MFKIGAEYSKKDIYKILNVPDEKQGGAWDTGYRLYNEEIFLFVNVGTESRTGVNHNNYFENDLLVWHGKNMSHIKQPLIKRMLESETKIHGFCRYDSSLPFEYYGTVSHVRVEETIPIKIIWKFNQSIL